MKNLADITNEYLAAIGAAISDDGVIDESLADQLTQAESALEEKIDRCCIVCDMLENSALTAKERAAAWAGRAKILEAEKDWLKKWIQHNVSLLDEEKIETKNYHVSLRKGAPSVEIDDMEFWKHDPSYDLYATVEKIDRREVLRRLKAGEKIPGATLRTDKKHLAIK